MLNIKILSSNISSQFFLYLQKNNLNSTTSLKKETTNKHGDHLVISATSQIIYTMYNRSYILLQERDHPIWSQSCKFNSAKVTACIS